MKKLLIALCLLGCEAPHIGIDQNLLTCGLTETDLSPTQNEWDTCMRYRAGPGFHITKGFEDACSTELETCVILQPGEWARLWADIDHAASTAKTKLQPVDCSEHC